jgi:hypothetical protein
VGTAAQTWRVVASCPRNRNVIGTVYVLATDKRQAVIIGRRALAQQGIKKLTCVTAHEWSPETDRELLRTGFVGPVLEVSR